MIWDDDDVISNLVRSWNDGMTVGRKAWHNTATQQQPTTTQLPLKRYAAFVMDLHLGHGCALVSLQTACAGTAAQDVSAHSHSASFTSACTCFYSCTWASTDPFRFLSACKPALVEPPWHADPCFLRSFILHVQCRSRSLSPSRPRHSP